MPVGDYGMKKIEIISENQRKFERAFSTPFCHNWTWNFWTGFDILFALGIIDIMMNVYGFKLIFKIVLAIVSIYLPDMVTGFMMVWDGFFNLVDTKADIGWIWSNYKIIYVS